MCGARPTAHRKSVLGGQLPFSQNGETIFLGSSDRAQIAAIYRELTLAVITNSCRC
jgi:hypothetical protein